MSSEYFGTLANPPTEYAGLDEYNKQSQFGPRLPPTAPLQNFPTVLEQPNKRGYDVLSYGTPNSGYYDVAQAYGNSCNPKFYVRECPTNKKVSPFVPQVKNTVNFKQNTGVENQLISEGFENPVSLEDAFEKLKPIHFFYLPPNKCSYCASALEMIRPYNQYFQLHDISDEDNLRLLTHYNGFAVPYFYASNGNSVTGLWKIEDLVVALLGRKLVPSPTGTPEPQGGDIISQELLKLAIIIFVMEGCHFCKSLISRFEKAGYLHHVRVEDGLAPHNRDKTSRARGFPFIVSTITNKHTEGDMEIESIIKKLK